jgi:Flp pilus assembly protein TadD
MVQVENRPGVAIPSHDARRLAAGHAHIRAGRLAEAKAAFAGVLDRDPRSAEAWHGLGLARRPKCRGQQWPNWTIRH